MKLIEAKLNTGSNIEKAIVLLTILCLVNKIKLSKKEIEVLAYYMVYKVKQETDDLMMRSKIVKSVYTLKNIKSILLKLGFMKRSKDLYNSYELNIDEELSMEDKIKLLITIDNSCGT